MVSVRLGIFQDVCLPVATLLDLGSYAILILIYPPLSMSLCRSLTYLMPYRDRARQNEYRREWYRRNAEKEIRRITKLRSKLRSKTQINAVLENEFVEENTDAVT